MGRTVNSNATHVDELMRGCVDGNRQIIDQTGIRKSRKIESSYISSSGISTILRIDFNKPFLRSLLP
jgi:hypothetical protein